MGARIFLATKFVLLVLAGTTLGGRDFQVGPGRTFADLPSALVESRKVPGSPRRIVLHGTIRIETPLVLGPEDEGLEIRGAEGERPRILGSRTLEAGEPLGKGIYRFPWTSASPPRRLFGGPGRLPRASEPTGPSSDEGPRFGLTRPGEWRVASEGKSILYRRTEREGPLHPPEATVSPSAFRLSRVSDVVIRGIDLFWYDGEALLVTDSTNILLEGLSVRGSGDENRGAVAIRGGRNVRVLDCEVTDSAEDAISLSGKGHAVENCRLNGFGRVFPRGIGLRVEGEGHRIEGNAFRDAKGVPR